MARDGRDRGASGDLAREAAEKLAAVKRTAAALEERLREQTERVGEAFDRTRDRLHGVDEFVHRHPYAFIGGALGLGFALARRSSSRLNVTAMGGDGVRYVLVERERPGIVRSLLGGAAALALRQGMSWLARQLEGHDEPKDPLFLPRDERPRPE